MVCIFPEGALTRDGELQPFKGGVMKLIEGLPEVPVIPMALGNLWGSFFSRVEGGKAMVKPMRRGVWSPVSLTVDRPMAPADVSPEALRSRVSGLLGTAASPAA
jgi:1-acyl-sn-glycerol-3-phosphate acyltransferase